MGDQRLDPRIRVSAGLDEFDGLECAGGAAICHQKEIGPTRIGLFTVQTEFFSADLAIENKLCEFGVILA